jgi:hypothetical protein
VENQQSTIMKNSIQKNRFRSNLGTRFLSSNGLGFGVFWSRTDNLKIPKDFFSSKELYFQEESAIFLYLSIFKLLFRSPQYESS